MSTEEIKDTERLHDAIGRMRNNAIPIERNGDYWSKEECEKVAELFYQNYGITEIALNMQRTERAIYQQIIKQELFEAKNRKCQERKVKCICSKCPVSNTCEHYNKEENCCV